MSFEMGNLWLLSTSKFLLDFKEMYKKYYIHKFINDIKLFCFYIVV